jgi:hypothetical protein
MYLSYILCCCDWETGEDSDVSPLRVPLKFSDHHSHTSGSVYQEPLIHEMCDLQVVPAQEILFRQEYSTLSSDNERRLSTAIARMTMCGKNDPSYFSPFFQTASHKKWIDGHSNYIPKHMMYLWFRAYLHDFEVALQQADIACGNDGRITLPYIDIKSRPCVPSAYKDFKLPSSYIQGNEELLKLNAMICDDERICRVLSGINISQYIHTDNINDLFHVIMNAYGFDSEYSSFHPFFYMVMCYIDKIHDTHNKYSKQTMTPKSVEYWKILVPFRKLPVELLETVNLGYKYL